MIGVTHFNAITDEIFGATVQDFQVATVFNFTTSNDEIETAVHEFGHFFGAPDHNTVKKTNSLNEGRTSNYFSCDCIYGVNKHTSPITENLTICDGCRKTISDSIANLS